MSAADEARLRELAEAATPGPWIADNQSNPNYFSVRARGVVCRLAITPHSALAAEGRATAELIAAARTAIPALLDALSAERERADRAVGLLRPFGLAADNMDGDEPDGLFIYDSPESTMISYGDLRAVAAFLATQSPSRTGEG